MKKKNNKFVTNFIISILVLSILVPMITILIWVFTERWAWPDLVPQVFSTRALREVLMRKEELAKVFVSSIAISTVVAFCSAAIGIMTARALVFYEFAGKKIISFLTILPFMVPGTVFAMGVQITFIKLGLNNTVVGLIIAHLICSLPYAGRNPGCRKPFGRAGESSGSFSFYRIFPDFLANACAGDFICGQYVLYCVFQSVFPDTDDWRRKCEDVYDRYSSVPAKRKPEHSMHLQRDFPGNYLGSIWNI